MIDAVKLRTSADSRSLVLHRLPEAVDILTQPPQHDERAVLRPVRAGKRIERMIGIGVVLSRQSENELPRPDHRLARLRALRQAPHSRLRHAVTNAAGLMPPAVASERTPYLDK